MVIDMSCLEIIFAILGIIVALVVGGGQIYIAKRVKDFEMRQDARDEIRRDEQIYSEATRFIQKYNNDNYKSEIYLLPLCVVAYKYNPVYPYRRRIYRDFCALTEDVQNEVLKRCNIEIQSKRIDTYYRDMINRIRNTIAKYYNDDKNYFYDSGKHFEKALTDCGTELIPNDIDFEEYLLNQEKPFSSLLSYFQKANECTAALICCYIAKYSAIYNYQADKSKNKKHLGYDCDYDCNYNGERYMEDMFLDALNSVEHYHIAKEK